MSGKKIGYIRVSSEDQNPERQLEGITLNKTFIDRLSGKDTQRPALAAMIDYVREDDIIIVHSMDRLARNLDDLRKLVFQLTQRQVKIQFIKENLIFTGEDSPMSHLLLSIMGAFAEFERSLIKERQVEGIKLAQKKGVYKGRKRSLGMEKIEELKKRISNGEPKSHVAKEFKISRETLYQYLKNGTIDS